LGVGVGVGTWSCPAEESRRCYAGQRRRNKRSPTRRPKVKREVKRSTKGERRRLA
jgi:hypothetical protein